MRNSFKPTYIKKANIKLDKYILLANKHKNTNQNYKNKLFKKTLWEKFLGIFTRKRNAT